MVPFKFTKSDYLFFIVIFIAFYALNRLTISTNDDFFYKFIGGASDGINGNYIPVKSFRDAIISQIQDYQLANGRFIAHLITNYFCGVVGIKIFEVINSLIFILLCIGITILTRLEFVQSKIDKFIIVLLLFLIPVPAQTLLGHMAMSINYLWTSCFIIYFLVLLKSNQKGQFTGSHFKRIITFLLCFICGSFQESFSIGLSIGLFIYYCFHLNDFKGYLRWIIIAFWLGTCFVTLAPSNFLRFNNEIINNDLSGISKYIFNIAHIFINSNLLLLLIIVNIILYFRNSNELKLFWKDNSIYFITIIANILFTTIVYTGNHQLTCINLFSLLLIINFIYRFIPVFYFQKYRNVFPITICIFLFLTYIPIYKYRVMSYKGYQELFNQDVNNGILIAPQFIDNTIKLKNNLLASNFTYHEIPDTWFKEGLSLYLSSGKDKHFVKAILPQEKSELISLCNPKNEYQNNIYYCKDKHFFIIKQKKEDNSQIYAIKEDNILSKLANLIINKDFNTDNITDITSNFTEGEYKYTIVLEVKRHIKKIILSEPN